MNLASPASTSRHSYPALALFQRPGRGRAERMYALDGDDEEDAGRDVKLGKGIDDGGMEMEMGRVGQGDTRYSGDDPPRPSGPQSHSQQSQASVSSRPRPPAPTTRWQKVKAFLATQLKYIGPGASMSVAYCDPGNWATDLSAGSQFGYRLLFVVLLTGIFGIVLQVLSARMGIVRGKDLAVMTREWVMSLRRGKEDRGPWPQRGRVALLWTLYLVAEGAIICTELAELVGSAIALNL